MVSQILLKTFSIIFSVEGCINVIFGNCWLIEKMGKMRKMEKKWKMLKSIEFELFGYGWKISLENKR